MKMLTIKIVFQAANVMVIILNGNPLITMKIGAHKLKKKVGIIQQNYKTAVNTKAN